MNIKSIDWPTDSKVAVSLYLNFIIEVIYAIKIRFPTNAQNPISITKEYINGNISNESYRSSANFWWGYLDDNEKIRDFSNHDALIARLAISLLSATESEASELGEHLSWFFEVIEQLGINLDVPINMMRHHFKFRKQG